jgi:hypothetical protein
MASSTVSNASVYSKKQHIISPVLPFPALQWTATTGSFKKSSSMSYSSSTLKFSALK